MGFAGTLIGSVLPTNTSNVGNSAFPPNTQGYNSQTAVAGPNGVVIYNDVMYVVNQNSQAQINGSVLAFQVPASVQKGKLDAKQLPFPRLLPDPIDSSAEYSPDAPRGIVIGGSPPALFVAGAAADCSHYESQVAKTNGFLKMSVHLLPVFIHSLRCCPCIVAAIRLVGAAYFWALRCQPSPPAAQKNYGML